jgi:hypothetical protein
MGYIIDFKNGSRCVFFSIKGAVSNFFFEKGAVGQKRLGTCALDSWGDSLEGELAFREAGTYLRHK